MQITTQSSFKQLFKFLLFNQNCIYLENLKNSKDSKWKKIVMESLEKFMLYWNLFMQKICSLCYFSVALLVV